MRILFVCVVGLGLGACGSVDSNGGNDVPSGPAIPQAGSGNDCTHNGAGVDVVVTPVFDTGAAAQAIIQPVPSQGLDPAVPACFDFTAQQPTAPAAMLAKQAVTVKDGVLQQIPNAKIVTQWFSWGEPTPGSCEAAVNAIVEVTIDSMPTCAVELVLGSEPDAPIGTYTVAAQ